MSEIHWAIRASVYGHGVTESKVEFVWGKINELQEEAEEIEYDVDLKYSYEEIQDLVESEGSAGGVAVFHQEKEGLIERFLRSIEIPGFDFDIEIPSLSDLLV